MSIIIIPNAELEAIVKILGDTSNGFSGTEIQSLLSICNIADTSPNITKWKRLYDACNQNQIMYKSGNHIGKLIEESMSPARYLKNKELWGQRLNDLNIILSLLGISLNNTGKLIATNKALTLDEALRRVDSLKEKLVQRNTHEEVFKYCTKELIDYNYFHAVFEACKGVANRLREKSRINKDGAEIIDIAFSIDRPLVAINTLESDSDKSEHKGFANLLRGIFGMIRNPIAHNPKLNWNMNEQDALDIFAMLSMVHRKIDNMVYIGKINKE